jgi:hypothetical protein
MTNLVVAAGWLTVGVVYAPLIAVALVALYAAKSVTR